MGTINRETATDRKISLVENSDTVCGAITQDNNKCIHTRGLGTDHPGEGRCWQHEFMVNGSPVKAYDIPALSERMEEFIRDTDIYSLDREIALLRSYLELYRKYLGFFKEFNETQLSELGIQFSPIDLNQALNSTTRTIAKLVDTKNNIEVSRKYVIDVKAVKLMFMKVADILDTNIEDPELKNSIGNQLGQLMLSG